MADSAKCNGLLRCKGWGERSCLERVSKVGLPKKVIHDL